MDKDVQTTQGHEMSADLTSESARGTRWMYVLVFGALSGTAMGVLNFSALANDWELGGYFAIFNRPVILAMYIARARFDFATNPDAWLIYWLLALVCYWAIIGVLLALLISCVRVRIIKGIFRDRTCRRALFFGACGGMLVGGLNCAAAANGWQQLGDCFEALDRPAITVIRVALEWLGFLDFLSGSPTAEFIAGLAVALVYWTVVGFFVAFLLCFIRVARKRKGAAEIGVPGEFLSEE